MGPVRGEQEHVWRGVHVRRGDLHHQARFSQGGAPGHSILSVCLRPSRSCSDCELQQQGGISEEEATRIAREIEGSQTTNYHLAEERGQVTGADDMDEEARFSSVHRGDAHGHAGGGIDKHNDDTFGSDVSAPLAEPSKPAAPKPVPLAAAAAAAASAVSTPIAAPPADADKPAKKPFTFNPNAASFQLNAKAKEFVPGSMKVVLPQSAAAVTPPLPPLLQQQSQQSQQHHHHMQQPNSGQPPLPPPGSGGQSMGRQGGMQYGRQMQQGYGFMPMQMQQGYHGMPMNMPQGMPMYPPGVRAMPQGMYPPGAQMQYMPMQYVAVPMMQQGALPPGAVQYAPTEPSSGVGPEQE